LKRYVAISLALLGLILVITLSKNPKSNPEISITDHSDWLAIVGIDTIDVSEFRYRFETSAFVGSGLSARENFLKAIVAERVLAHNSESLNLDTIPQAGILIDQLSNEVLVEKLLKREVDSRIEISDSEIREEFIRSLRTLTLSAWQIADSTIAFETAKKAHNGQKFSEIRVNAPANSALFISERQLIHNQFDSRFEDHAYPLKPGETSRPFKVEGFWWILHLLRFEQESVPSEALFASRKDLLRNQIFTQKSETVQQSYIKSLMDGQQMNIERENYDSLVDYLLHILPDPKEAQIPQMIAQTNSNFLSEIEPKPGFLNSPILTLTKGRVVTTISGNELLSKLYAMPLELLKSEPSKFNSDLRSTIIWLIEFDALNNEAFRQGLFSDEIVLRNQKIWRSHVKSIWGLRELEKSRTESTENEKLISTSDMTVDKELLSIFSKLADGEDIQFNLTRLNSLNLNDTPVLLRKTHFPRRPETPIPVGYHIALEWNPTGFDN
jgi:hypothetical protein